MPTHAVDNQARIFAFLRDPATYGLKAAVQRIDTHGAAVFLAGSDVYKVKRAVRFPYMDFSTLENRRVACEAEIRVNRNYAPMIYLETVPITCDADGLHLRGQGEIVEWTVHMRRFDETMTFDRLVERDLLPGELIDDLARVVAASHRQAALGDGKAATEVLRGVLLSTLDELSQSFDRWLSEALGPRLLEVFSRGSSLLHSRGAGGKVRRCHGDLHLRNIVLLNNKPVLFDAIEFDEALATTDTLYDLAFLLMDLCERGHNAEATRLLNHYLWSCEDESGEIKGLALLPMFLSLRAAIRAKVIIAQTAPDAATVRNEAEDYLTAAARFLKSVDPRLVAIGGFSGTGKTTLAIQLAPRFGMAPGAVHLRSDIERKRLFGVAQTTRLPDSSYRSEVSHRIYGRLRELAETALLAGRSVVVDASFQCIDERIAIEQQAIRLGVSFAGLWLEAPRETLVSRVVQRQGDASDATIRVVADQLARDPGPISWTRLNAEQPLSALTVAAEQLLT
jgi:aminoglycoside phosphotransferase family enzyme/predicted kinase